MEVVGEINVKWRILAVFQVVVDFESEDLSYKATATE